jgi:hypothetical protein
MPVSSGVTPQDWFRRRSLSTGVSFLRWRARFTTIYPSLPQRPAPEPDVEQVAYAMLGVAD